ncbi:MAG: DUF4402 domain-containing protein [candidate division Zixibacteria bacterium]|nr:DUF4402 domain-containing protein [candidate division Zixibacteria bacterium]
MNSMRQPGFFVGKIVFTALVIAFGFGGLTNAQDVANGEAVATVMAGLLVTAVQNLDFGSVLQGVAQIQDQTDDLLSGIFRITGQEDAEISMYMQLPDYLATDPAGDDRMTVSFDVDDVTLDTSGVAGSPAAPGAGAVVGENPHNLPTIRLGGAGALPFQCRVYLGGKVTPTVDQTAGNYSGDVTLSVAYTGN